MVDSTFKDLSPNPMRGLYSAEHVAFGIPVPKTKRIELFSADEWEEFTEEWATSLSSLYYKIKRFSGSGDQGLDIVGFVSDSTFGGGWRNYQCKFYDHPLYPSDVWVEFGKLIYYCHRGDYPPPEKYYFVAPKQLGTTLGKLLSSPNKLKEELRKNWAASCQGKITATSTVILEDDFLRYFNSFDFSIFDSVSLSEMIIGHATTSFHTVRFGGGLGVRPEPTIPPENTVNINQRYVRQLLAVYAQTSGIKSNNLDISIIEKNESHKKNFHRQRERFYHAESLRNFSRDTVPDGTFDQLQNEIYQGVVDINEYEHETSFECMKQTISQAANISIQSNPLSSVTKVADKQGICHQLVDLNRLSWVKNDE